MEKRSVNLFYKCSLNLLEQQTLLNLAVGGRNVSTVEGKLQISVSERHGYSSKDVVPLHQLQVAVFLLAA